MRRLLPLALCALVVVGCSSSVPGGRVTTPTPQTIVGKTPKPPTVVGDPAAGKAVFVSTGCGACHTLTAAGTTGKVGPDLDHLAAYAKAANQSLLDFAKTSIIDPGAYVAPGFPNGVMPGNYGQTLTPQQIADLVALLTKGS